MAKPKPKRQNRRRARTSDVTLRAPKQREPKGSITIRCPQSLLEWAAALGERKKAQRIVGAMALERELERRLSSDKDRLARYADDLNLSMADDVGEIFARLIRRGLDSHEYERLGRERSGE